MNIVYGNFWDEVKNFDACVITTNGFTKKNGGAVMGRGIALEAKNKLPTIEQDLGKLILEKGNHVHIIYNNKSKPALVSFPVKPTNTVAKKDRSNVVKHCKAKTGSTVPGFHAKASMRHIIVSCRELVKLADKEGWDSILLPRPGCGAGELSWTSVYKTLVKYLDDRFTVITFPVKRRKTIFISGSRNIAKLGKANEDLLDSIIGNDIKVIVGDCYGVDNAVQKHFKRRNYKAVTVYHVDYKARHDNGYPTHKIEGAWFDEKDKAMVTACTFGMVIIRDNSKGSANNIKHLKKLGKKVKVVNYEVD